MFSSVPSFGVVAPDLDGTGLFRRLSPVDSSIGSTIDPSTISTSHRIILSCLQAVAVYNAVELVFIVLYTFKRRSGLYFWSMMVSTLGVALNASAFIVNDNGFTTHRIIPALMIIFGWIPMTTGQAFVLYSRLHLLYLSPRSLRLVLIMIITNAIVGHVPTSVVIFGSNSSNPGPFLVPYSIYEKIEVTIFFLQEIVLSGIYLWKCLEFWRSQRLREATKIRGIIQHLVLVNILIVALDVTILLLEYSGMYIIQTSYKAFVYSVKLKVEISILNRLVDFVRATRRVEYQDRITKEMKQEWTDTLQRTIGGTTNSNVTNQMPSLDIEMAGPQQEKRLWLSHSTQGPQSDSAQAGPTKAVRIQTPTEERSEVPATEPGETHVGERLRGHTPENEVWPLIGPASTYAPKEVKRRGEGVVPKDGL